MKSILRLLTIILCAFSINSFAATPTQQLQGALASIKTMRANFSQTVRSGRRVVQRTNGSMALIRPGRFRWYSTQPTKQLIIADGKNLWVYDKDLQQVTVRALRNGLQDTPAAFLSGSNKTLARDYKVKILKTSRGQQRYQLTPRRSRASFRYIDLNLSGNRITSMRLVDKLGQTTDLRFSSVRVNQRLSSNLFRFRVPRGVDVVGRPVR